jgi:hypothetical protein
MQRQPHVHGHGESRGGIGFVAAACAARGGYVVTELRKCTVEVAANNVVQPFPTDWLLLAKYSRNTLLLVFKPIEKAAKAPIKQFLLVAIQVFAPLSGPSISDVVAVDLRHEIHKAIRSIHRQPLPGQALQAIRKFFYRIGSVSFEDRQASGGWNGNAHMGADYFKRAFFFEKPFFVSEEGIPSISIMDDPFALGG